MAAGLLLLHLLDEAWWRRWLPQVAEHLNRVLRGEGGSTPSSHTALALLGAITLLHVMGLVDDRRSLGPWLKLLVQAAAALPLAIWFDVRLLEALGPVPSVLITVAWVLVVTNAMNFIDNMDGLAGGVGAIAAGLFLAAAIVNQQWFIAAVLALLIGGLAGFLVFNFPPARIFMGDGGSLVLGFILAVLTVRTTYFGGDRPVPLGSAWYGVLMPLVVLAIPLYDLVTVSLIRLRQGRSPLVGDQQHFSHRLVQRGLSRRGAVIVIWAATAVTGIGGISLGRLAGWQAILVGVQTASVWLMLALLEHASRHAVATGTRRP
jgi:UDP-GlcNAc:undecaprenyl-phosphate GlcNAc-1-phosphate transferase